MPTTYRLCNYASTGNRACEPNRIHRRFRASAGKAHHFRPWHQFLDGLCELDAHIVNCSIKSTISYLGGKCICNRLGRMAKNKRPVPHPIICVTISIDVTQLLPFSGIHEEWIRLEISYVVTYSTWKNTSRSGIETL